jgi:hypothetical protein
VNRLAYRGVVGLAAISMLGCGDAPTTPTSAPPAMTTVALDFDAIPPPSPPTEGVVQHNCPYTEDGFTLDMPSGGCRPTGLFVSVHMPPNPMGQYSIDRYTGSVSFSNFNWFGVTRLTRDAGGSFALISIDLDGFNPLSTVVPGGPTDASQPQTVTFTGTRQDGTTVTQAFTTDTVFPRSQTFIFTTAFADVVKVEWPQLGPAFHQFDNIVVATRAQ